MSWQVRLLNLALRLSVKPILARAQDPAANAHLMDRGARRFFRAPPLALYREARITPELRGLWLAARPASRPVPSDKIFLYFHGGGFIAGSPETHAAMLARIGWMSGVEALLPDYRIAPEHAFPAALEDCRAAWEMLLSKGFRPENIVIGGDSAGGNLALVLTQELVAQGRPPAGVVAISPLTDFTFSGASMRENAARDPILPASRGPDVARWYLAGADPEAPGASPLFAEWGTPPPMLFHYGETEILRDDSTRMVEVLRRAGGEVRVSSWPDTPHVFHIFDGYIPEARAANREIADFISASLGLR